MTLKELHDKIGQILEEIPSLADANRIGIVVSTDEMGFKYMELLKDFRTINCDGMGMVGFQLVMESDE